MSHQSHLKLFIVIELFILYITACTFRIIFFKKLDEFVISLISFHREVFLSLFFVVLVEKNRNFGSYLTWTGPNLACRRFVAIDC